MKAKRRPVYHLSDDVDHVAMLRQGSMVRRPFVGFVAQSLSQTQGSQYMLVSYCCATSTTWHTDPAEALKQLRELPATPEEIAARDNKA